MKLSPQDAGSPKPEGALSPPRSHLPDLYGTGSRLHDLSRKCDRLATRCEAMGCPNMARRYRERGLFYAQQLLALALEGDAGRDSKRGQSPSQLTIREPS